MSGDRGLVFVDFGSFVMGEGVEVGGFVLQVLNLVFRASDLKSHMPFRARNSNGVFRVQLSASSLQSASSSCEHGASTFHLPP